MIFSVLINSAPTSQQSAHTAYQFCKAALENQHQISRIFFYQDGVYNANKFNAAFTHATNLVHAWQTLATQYQIELILCVTSATQRGIIETNLADTFKISGLGQLLDAVINADRFISFG